MTDTPQIERPVLQVELNDGTTHTVTILNPSLVAWDRTRATRKWPTAEQAGSLWSTFVSWHQLKALGVIDCTYDQYESEVCVMVGDPPAADGQPADEPTTEPVDPTLTAAEPG